MSAPGQGMGLSCVKQYLFSDIANRIFDTQSLILVLLVYSICQVDLIDYV